MNSQMKCVEQLDEQKDALFKIISPKSYHYSLYTNILPLLPIPEAKNNSPKKASLGTSTILTKGDFQYFHYGCDGFHDNGWGCGYRTLQAMCSWILHKRNQQNTFHIPSLTEIQQILVQLNDKPKSFLGSKDWIGALEVCYVVDALYDVASRIIHVATTDHLRNHIDELERYFQENAGFVMMGGNIDASSKGIAGIHRSGDNVYLLVVDPHYSGIPTSKKAIIDQGYIHWQHINDFIPNSFYNFCLPYIK